ncbi:MAG TPA: carbonic anhydrase [Anseongella sp.]|nr:carbonic anhydrase [Anseongella sp.]
MRTLGYIFKNNDEWVKNKLSLDPDYFKRLEAGQQPEFMWIACSDSRILPNEMAGLGAGEMFVHRNIANLVQHNDINLLAAIQYAVDILKIKHLVVCGHYGCGGVQASLGDSDLGLIDIWIRQIKDLAAKHSEELAAVEDPKKRVDRLVELNVLQQVKNLEELRVVKNARERNQELFIHAWVFNMSTGKIVDLNGMNS